MLKDENEKKIQLKKNKKKTQANLANPQTCDPGLETTITQQKANKKIHKVKFLINSMLKDEVEKKSIKKTKNNPSQPTKFNFFYIIIILFVQGPS